jgi:hypothetical protein
MRSTIRRLASVLAIGLIGAALAAGSAAAAPVNAPNAIQVPLDCGDAGTFEVVVNGNGAFSPGHIVGDGGVLVPFAFGDETFTLTDTEGNVLVEETEPAHAKGPAKPKRHRTVVECTYSFSFELDGNTATVSGSVTAFRTGRGA